MYGPQVSMGAVHSRRGTGPAKDNKIKEREDQQSPAKGYFIVSFKGNMIRAVNAKT